MGKKNYFYQKPIENQIVFTKIRSNNFDIFFIEIGFWILYDLVCNPFPKNVPLKNYKYIILQDSPLSAQTTKTVMDKFSPNNIFWLYAVINTRKYLEKC